MEYFLKDGYAIKFDLKSGYHHVDIFPEHRKYLGFSWVLPNGNQKYFIFNVLPFGLSSAPYLFTKLLRPLVKLWRSRGFHCVVYLDDGIDLEPSLEEACRASHNMRGDLRAAGFIVNEGKSEWNPTQCLIWLGIVWNLENGTLSIDKKRIEKASNLVSNALSVQRVSARQLAAIVGSIISMSAVMGRLGRIMSRHCQIAIAIADQWDNYFQLDEYCLHELEFWQNNINRFNENSCGSKQSHYKIVYSDASQNACGAYIEGREDMICHRMFTNEEKKLSSTHRELIAIHYSLESFGDMLANSRIKWYTDNQSTARIVEVGSMKFDFHLISSNIFSFCLKHNIDLAIEWIPRELNTHADYISKLQDCDDWQLSNQFFEYIDALWGPHTVDCFATFYNTKVRRFFSRFWNPGSAGTDAFFQSWEGENCLIVPPVSLVPKVLRYMSVQPSTVGTLIVPYWTSAVFWPLLW